MDADSADRLAGSLIDGRYRIERTIGAGGFGTVYAARHVGFDAPVAVKVLTLPEGVKPQRQVELVGGFLEEARTLKRLRHPNIVSALDVGLLPADERGVQRPYLVMDWCSGPTLGDSLEERGGPMSVAEAWQLFQPILDAMSHVHALGIAHRDLKPANVLLEQQREGGAPVPRIIDFGIAKIVAPREPAGSGATNTTSGSSPLTPRYASPEQVAGARTGPWTDVHALALLFVEMVTGRPAIGRDDNALAAVIDPERPTPKRLGVDVGPLEPVLERALAIRPDDRYPDAAALATAMRSAIESGGQVGVVASSAPVAAPTARIVDPAQPLARFDRTAPPSSHTFRTRTGELPPRAPTGGLRTRRAIGIGVAAATAALVVAAGVAAGVQRYSGGWPFRTRLRDLSGAEVERRTTQLGLDPCSSTHSPQMTAVGCAKGAVLLLQVIPQITTPQGVREHILSQALAQARSRGLAAKFAIDDHTAVIVVTKPEMLAEAFATVVGRADADVIADAVAPPPPKRSQASLSSLSAWTASDMVASVTEATAEPMASELSMDPSFAMLRHDGRTATIYIHRQHGGTFLEMLRASGDKTQMAYARDGNVLLTVQGDPLYTNVDYIRRLLAGASAAEVGMLPKP